MLMHFGGLCADRGASDIGCALVLGCQC